MMERNICFASVVSEIQQSDIYMTVKARLFETPKANLNGARVTAAFIDEIVNNEDKYVGLPLCADAKSLADRKYGHLGHLYDAETGEFHSTQIGSFYKFEKEEFEGGAYLVGYARILKRNKEICSAIAELFSRGDLKFSFEITCGSYEKLEDGTIMIDASDNNYLEGVAVVSCPACEDAVALDLVAESEGEQEMENEKLVAEEATDTSVNAEAEAEEVAEKKVPPFMKKDEDEEEEKEEEDEEVDGACKKKGACGKKKAEAEEEQVAEEEAPTTEETVEEPDKGATPAPEEIPAEPAAEETPAEEAPTEENTDHTEAPEETTETPEPAAEKEDWRAVLESLKAEIAELKGMQEKYIASLEEKKVNPFIAEITAPVKYSLLEKEESTKSYSLLEKA